MRVAGVLPRYIAWRLTLFFFAILGVIILIIFMVDAAESLRRFGEREGVETMDILGYSLLRLPSLIEQFLPFAVLLAAMACLLDFSRKLELVVARSNGLSVWNILAIPLLLAAFFGVLATALLNPLATTATAMEERLEVSLLEGRGKAAQPTLWFRQSSGDGASILSAGASALGNRRLGDVTAYVFERDGAFMERVDASSAVYAEDRWILTNARVTRRDAQSQTYTQYLLGTNLGPEQLDRALAQPENLSVWELPGFIRAARAADMRTEPFSVAFHSLLARPLFFAAMVLIAATVSLRLFRYGGIARLSGIGIFAGFAFYVFLETMRDLGASGIVSPAFAAWSPPIIAATFGATALLHLEDG